MQYRLVVRLKSNHLSQREVWFGFAQIEGFMWSAMYWVVAPGKVLTKTFHSGFSFFVVSHQFVCLIILSSNIMIDFLLDLGFSFGWPWSLDSRQILLASFSILDLFFAFSLDVGRTSALVMDCVLFCAAGNRDSCWNNHVVLCCISGRENFLMILFF